MCGVVLVSLIHVNNLCAGESFGLMIWFPVRTSVQTSHAEKFKMVHRVQFLNLAASQQICLGFASFDEGNIAIYKYQKKIAKALKVCIKTFSKSIFPTRRPLNVLRFANGNFKYR